MRMNRVWLIVGLIMLWTFGSGALAQQFGRPDTGMGMGGLLGQGGDEGGRSGGGSGAAGATPSPGGVMRPTIINRSLTGVRDAAAEEKLRQPQQPPPQAKGEQWNEFQ